jgi:folate-binding protein YgfZ
MMTEPALSTPAQPTPVADFLATSPTAATGHAGGLMDYCGVLTPQHLDAPEQETAALFQGAAVHDLGWVRRVAVLGQDRSRWLSGMVTNSVEDLDPNGGAYNLVLNAQGRIQGDLYVWRNDHGLELEITADQFPALLDHLDHFIIMDDVELTALEGVAALGLAGPEAEQVLARLRIAPLAKELTSAAVLVTGASAGSTYTVPTHLRRIYSKLAPHYALWAKTEDIPKLWQALESAGATPVGAAALETLRVVEGIPGYGIDIQSRDLAQETSQTRALHYTKGCYLGQEIVERIRSRGQVHRHLRSLEIESAASEALPGIGTELRMAGAAEDSKPAAVLTSVASLQLHGTRHIYALAMVRAEAEVGAPKFTFPGGTATLLNGLPELKFPASPQAGEETA